MEITPEMQNKKKWYFDIGTDHDHTFMVEARASIIPHIAYFRLSHEQLKQLRDAISAALRKYQ